MKQEMIFTQDELTEMGTRTVDLIERAIDLGDYEKAKKLSRRLSREALAMHDLYRDWITALLTFIGRFYGDKVLYQALEESISMWLKPVLDMYEKEDTRRRVQLCAAALRGHCQPVEIKEDEEKFVFKMKPCGSGGRLVLEGKYGSLQNFLKVERPQAMTYWKKDFPVYCCHGHFLSSLPLTWGRAPAFLEIASDNIGYEPCEFWVFKDPKAIPQDVYTKIGLMKSENMHK